MIGRLVKIVVCLTVTAVSSFAQERVTLTLDEAIMRARSHSVDAAVALNSLKSAYWQWRAYRADLLPEISFKATVPAYHRQYSPYMNESGSYSFVHNDYMQLNGEISLSQNIWLTGGRVSVNTSLDIFRQMGREGYDRFMSIPVAITLTQPVFGVNNIKWNRRIEPIRYAEAKAEFVSATEDVAITAITLYFQLLMARENLEIARNNYSNSLKLYEVAKEKRNMGMISGNDLLQMELNSLNASSDLTECESTMRSSMFQLRSFLDMDENTEIDAVIPDDIPVVGISYPEALEKAMANNKHAHNLMRRRLEAEYDVAKAKGELRNIDIYAQIGYTGTDKNLQGAYNSLRSNQVVEVGLSIPLLDWGKRRGKVKVAESLQNVVECRLKKENLDFNQNLFILLERYSNQRQQLEISERADEIAARRYAVNMETFIIGKISTLDLNDSRVKKDEARREYVNELYKFWQYYYQLRSITLWDFSSNTPIEVDFEKLINH